MRVSSEKINSAVKKEILDLLFQIFADTKNIKEAGSLLTDILSEAELISIAKRVAIAYYLSKGQSYSQIKKALKISSATISEIQSQSKKEGFKIALRKIENNEWAEKWEKKIKSLFGK